MIILYSGTPGSGKSLNIARRLIDRIRGKRPVIGNFETDFSCLKLRKRTDNYLYIDDSDLVTPERLIYFSQNYGAYIGRRLKEDEVLVVIDEAQILFNPRDYSTPGRKEWVKFFTQHRKYGFEIVLISQVDRMIDRQIRSLFEYEYVHRKVSNYGYKGKILSLFCGGRLFVVVKIWYPMKEKIGSEFFVGKKYYFKIYDTFKIFGT